MFPNSGTCPIAKLTPVQDFEIASSGDTQPPVSQLCKGGQCISVPGKDLEAQFATADGHWLLILTDDCPYEETVRVVLLSDDLAIVDQLEFFAEYNSIAIQSVDIRLANLIDLHCNENRTLQVELFDEPLGILRGVTAKISNRCVSNNRLMELTIL